jgi:hypothetical protein
LNESSLLGLKKWVFGVPASHHPLKPRRGFANEKGVRSNAQFQPRRKYDRLAMMIIDLQSGVHFIPCQV